MILHPLSRELTKNDQVALYEIVSAHPSLGWNLEMLKSSLSAAHSLAYGLFLNSTHLIAGALFNAIEDEAELLLLATHPDFLKQGTAIQLLSATFEKLSKKGIQHIFLEVRTGNTPAICLYQKLGFQRIGIRRGYYKNPTEDAEIYTRCSLLPSAGHA